MRRHGLVLLCTLLLAAGVATSASAHLTPKIRAQMAHAHEVRAEINQIGINLESVIQSYDGAQIQLQRVEDGLRRNTYKLGVAKKSFHAAQRRLMSRLYSLYVYGKPSTLDVLAGSTSINALISRAESAQVLSNQDAALGRQALHFEQVVQQRQHELTVLKAKRAATVERLASRKQEIQSALNRQNRLLASIHSTIHTLQVQEARHQALLKAEALARLRQEAEARRAAARAAQAQQSQSSGGVLSSPVPIPLPIGGTGAGHPQAAAIALNYLGVPYVWGGSTPSGFDCSGLVMYVYAKLGISLAHYTGAQWSETQPIALSAAQPGDLIFFDGLGHVGIYLGNGQMVDAPHTGAVVRVESIYGFGSIDGARRVP